MVYDWSVSSCPINTQGRLKWERQPGVDEEMSVCKIFIRPQASLFPRPQNKTGKSDNLLTINATQVGISFTFYIRDKFSTSLSYFLTCGGIENILRCELDAYAHIHAHTHTHTHTHTPRTPTLHIYNLCIKNISVPRFFFFPKVVNLCLVHLIGV